jgi:hypothetical protein
MTCVQLQVVHQIDLIMYNCDTGGIPQNCDLDSVAMDIDAPEIDKISPVLKCLCHSSQ